MLLSVDVYERQGTLTVSSSGTRLRQDHSPCWKGVGYAGWAVSRGVGDFGDLPDSASQMLGLQNQSITMPGFFKPRFWGLNPCPCSQREQIPQSNTDFSKELKLLCHFSLWLLTVLLVNTLIEQAHSLLREPPRLMYSSRKRIWMSLDIINLPHFYGRFKIETLPRVDS